MHGHDHGTHAGSPSSEASGLDNGRRKLHARWVFLAFAAIAAVFLLKEHRAHLLGALPWILIAACPLLHMFMHGGHGGHGGHGQGPRPSEPPARRESPREGR
jgi:hypothetical protein